MSCGLFSVTYFVYVFNALLSVKKKGILPSQTAPPRIVEMEIKTTGKGCCNKYIATQAIITFSSSLHFSVSPTMQHSTVLFIHTLHHSHVVFCLTWLSNKMSPFLSSSIRLAGNIRFNHQMLLTFTCCNLSSWSS